MATPDRTNPPAIHYKVSSDYFWSRSRARGGTHAALRTARRRGKPRLRDLVAAGAVAVTCAGLGPTLAVSRLSRATRRSHGSLPQHASRRTSVPTAVRLPSPQGASERRDCERRDTLQRVKRARSVTAAQLTELRGSPTRGEEPVFPRRRTGAPGQNARCGDGRCRLKIFRPYRLQIHPGAARRVAHGKICRSWPLDFLNAIVASSSVILRSRRLGLQES